MYANVTVKFTNGVSVNTGFVKLAVVVIGPSECKLSDCFSIDKEDSESVSCSGSSRQPFQLVSRASQNVVIVVNLGWLLVELHSYLTDSVTAV